LKWIAEVRIFCSGFTALSIASYHAEEFSVYHKIEAKHIGYAEFGGMLV
jgi:hypothetical protein|tara:strand:+ start:1015 stop:1161 length:147 start_codon:yes stop_codon:yes gene_type:complete